MANSSQDAAQDSGQESSAEQYTTAVALARQAIERAKQPPTKPFADAAAPTPKKPDYSAALAEIQATANQIETDRRQEALRKQENDNMALMLLLIELA